jgi:7,8-dihydro-6-hydroxymethylpterin-pyrophosphokinase
VQKDGLIVPHPELSKRDFWLTELATLRSARVD